MAYDLVIIGGGNMGAALLGGLLAAGAEPASVAVSEPIANRRLDLVNEYPGVAVTDGVPACRAAVIAVKPADVAAATTAAVAAGAKRLLSVAAGVPTAALELSAGDPDIVVVRAMPNTPAIVGEGAAAIAPGRQAGDNDLAWAEGILGSVGKVVRVAEHDLDAVTALSGSGPAYLFLVAESLIEAGTRAGLTYDLATALTTQLLTGSAKLLAERGDPAALRVQVTSPGGTTEAGLAVLDERGVRDAFIDAVAAATARSVELGRP